MTKFRIRPSKRTLILVVAIVIFLSIIAFAQQNLSEMIDALSGANYLLVAGAFGLYLTSVLFWAARWRISLSAVGHNVGLRSLYPVIFGSIFIDNVTPFAYAGGDPIARAYLLNKTQWVPYSSGFATIIAELMLDLPIFLSFLMLGLLMSFYAVSIWDMITVTGVWVLVITSLYALFSYVLSKRMAAEKMSGITTRFLRIFKRRVNKTKVSNDVENFYGGAHSIISRTTVASTVLCYSAIIWIFGMLRLFIIFQAFSYLPSLSMLMLAVTLPLIAGLLPFLPGGLGTVDVTMVSIFLLFGVPVNIAISVVLIERVINFVFGTVVGAFMLSYLGVKAWKGLGGLKEK